MSGAIDFMELWQAVGGELISSRSEKIVLPTTRVQPQQNESDLKLEGYTLRVSQMKGLQQQNGDSSCGYFCLYFGSLLAKCFKIMSDPQQRLDETQLIGLLQQILDRKSYEQFKTTMLDYLLTEMRYRNALEWNDSGSTEPCYPWLEDMIKSDVLERAYLQTLQRRPRGGFNRHYIVPKDKDGNAAPPAPATISDDYNFQTPRDVINLNDFSVTAIRRNRLPLRELHAMTTFFQSFHNHRTSHWKIFLIGSAIHYVLVFVYRNDSAKTVDIVYIDPQNNDILTKNADELQKKVISHMKFQSWIKAGWKRHAIERLALDSMQGIQFVVGLLDGAVKHYENDRHLQFTLIRFNFIDGFTKTFDERVLTPIIQYITENFPNNNLTTIATDEKESKTDDKNETYAADVLTRMKQATTQTQTIIAELKDLQSRQERNWFGSAKETPGDPLSIRIEAFQTFTVFLQHFIKVVYPAPVIEENTIGKLSQLQPNIPMDVVKLLQAWAEFVAIFCDKPNRRAANMTSDERFWRRLSSTAKIGKSVAVRIKQHIRLLKNKG